jgi:hypothetical protein
MINKKKIISYILGLILSILLIVIILIGSINNSVFNKAYIRTVFHKTDYYYGMYVIIQDDMKSDIMPSGFEEKVLDNIITEDKVREDVNIVLNNLYDNKNDEISTEDMKKKLDENVQEQIKEKNFTVTEENKKAIEEFENSVIDIYTDNINYSSTAVNKVGNMINKIQKALIIAIGVLAVISVALAVIIFRLNAPGLGISVAVAGMFFVIINLYSGTAIVVNNILMFNWAFSKAVTYLVSNLIGKMYVIGLVLAVLGIAEVVVFEYFRARELMKYWGR